MPLNSNQKAAVEYLSGPLLVLAGPGTGKTQLLANKVEYILSNTDANPENILCLTFTEAGVSAMRERLLSMRVDNADKITISTYHAFGSNILAQYKNFSEHFNRNLDETIHPVAQYKLIKEIILDLPATDILRSGDPSTIVKDIITTISEAKAARLTPDDLRKIAEYNQQESAEIAEALSSPFSDLVPRMKFNDAVELVYRPIAEELAEIVSDQPIVKNIYPVANQLLISLNEALESQMNAEKPSIKPLSAWKDKYFEKDAAGEFRLKDRIANKKLVSLANVMEIYTEKLKETGQYDFSDMIEEAISALKTDADFKASLQERYQYILLDEFQDTNPSQFELIRLLTDYENPLVMAVGDDDQAIFAFQGAEASNLIDFTNTYNAKVITLTDNYRSTAEILDFSRKIADQISDSFAKNHHIEKILASVRNDEILAETTRDGSFISRHEFKGADSEYAWVAREIHRLIESGESQDDIAIIAPKHKFITPLLPYLKAYPEINIAYERRENVLEDEKIHELTTLLRFIYELAEDKNPSHRLLEILSFDFWQLDPLAVVSAVQGTFKDQRRALDFLLESSNEDLKSVAAFLADLVTKSFTLPLEQCIRIVVDKMAACLDENETYSLYENLAVLRENLASYIVTEKPRLKDLVNFLDDFEAASATILNTSPYQDSSNSVQILSAHKSKGLEYKHVFLISVDSMSWGRGKGNNNKFSLPRNLESIRHTGITEDEQLRLFFVAITRAKLRLVMTNSIQNFAGKKPNRLEYLGEYTVDENSIASPLLPNPDVVEHYDTLPENQKLSNLEKHWLASYLDPTPDLKTLLKKRMEKYRLTASDLTTFIDIVYGGPMEFYKRKVLRAPAEPASTAIILGNLIHATFENVTNNSISNTEALEFYKQSASKVDLSPEDIKFLEERGAVSLVTSLTRFADILRHKNARAEVDLSHEHLAIPNGESSSIPITGKIDHINIDDKNKTIEIYDFKTGTYKTGGWESNISLYKYSLQLGFYKLLLKYSPTYSKYKVSRAHILFVSPDADGEVYDKVLEFSEEFEQHLISLTKRVWEEATALDFVNEDNPLHVFGDTSRSVRDVREFVKLILEEN